MWREPKFVIIYVNCDLTHSKLFPEYAKIVKNQWVIFKYISHQSQSVFYGVVYNCSE